MKTIDGSYNATEESSLEQDTSFADYSSLVSLDSETLALAYSNVIDRGIAKTFEVEAPAVALSGAAFLAFV